MRTHRRLGSPTVDVSISPSSRCLDTAATVLRRGSASRRSARSRRVARRPATTHWRKPGSFQARYHDVRLDRNVLYVGGDVPTSAGAASRVDPCVHIIRRAAMNVRRLNRGLDDARRRRSASERLRARTLRIAGRQSHHGGRLSATVLPWRAMVAASSSPPPRLVEWSTDRARVSDCEHGVDSRVRRASRWR
jgi:hypothetical protein